MSTKKVDKCYSSSFSGNFSQINLKCCSLETLVRLTQNGVFTFALRLVHVNSCVLAQNSKSTKLLPEDEFDFQIQASSRIY